MEDCDPLKGNSLKEVVSDPHGLGNPLATTSSEINPRGNEMYVEPEASFLSSDCEYAGGDTVSDVHLSHSAGGYEFMGDGVDEDDEGLYLAISSMPVKVEIEEEGDCELKTDDYGASYGDTVINSSFVAAGDGIASTSGIGFYSETFLPAMENLGLDIIHRMVKEPRKKSRRRALQEKSFREIMCGGGLGLVQDIGEVEAKKQRGESLTTTEEVLLMKKRDRERQQKRRQNMTEEERMLERQKNRERKRQKRILEKQALLQAGVDPSFARGKPRTGRPRREDLPLEVLEEKRLRERDYKRERRRLMSKEQIDIERKKNRERKRKKRELEKASEAVVSFMAEFMNVDL